MNEHSTYKIGVNIVGNSSSGARVLHVISRLQQEEKKTSQTAVRVDQLLGHRTTYFVGGREIKTPSGRTNTQGL